MRVISHMSFFAPGCPQSNPHYYAFMPDLCDVGCDVTVSFLPALQEKKKRVLQPPRNNSRTNTKRFE